MEISEKHQMMFCSFKQDNDSVLNNEGGRKKLKDAGIKLYQDVGEWLVEAIRCKPEMVDLADKLHSFLCAHCL